MNDVPLLNEVVFTHFHLFCGLGAAAKGFNKGTARVGNFRAKFRCVGGVDNDPAAVRDFGRLAKVPGTLLDMFDREQYRAFHGRDPDAGWREATPDDIRRAAGGEFPDVVFLSAPCKGFSGLLPESSSKTAKYQALNRLTLRGVWLMLEAFKDDLPKLIIFENVPRIMKRGRGLLDQIVALLRAYGYAVAETTHDCGEIGGLGQSRKRFLLVARHEAKVPPFLYQPEKKRLRGVGEILERLPLPGDARGGPLHRIPALQWKTWVRLAFVEAGSDWRSLNKLEVEQGVLRDFGILPVANWHDDILGVLPWNETSRTVTGNASATTGRFSVADPRSFSSLEGSGFLGVREWSEPSGTVTANGRPGSGNFSVADPRPPEGSLEYHQYGVRRWGEPSGSIINVKAPGQGTFSVADPRLEEKPRFTNVFRIVSWCEESPAIAVPGGPAGGLAVSDPRPAPRDDYKQTKYRVTSYEEAAGTVISASTTGNGAFAVADPNVDWGPETHPGKLKVKNWDENADAVTGARFGSGAGAVADPRPGYGEGAHQNILAVTDWDDRAKTVTGARHVARGALSVADPRPPHALQGGVHGVHGWDDSSGTVRGESLPSNGAFAVADPRPVGLNENRDHYKSGGHYGVTPWAEHSGAVPAFGKYDRGPWSVADPRGGEGGSSDRLPEASDRLIAVIRALDGTWHRPFTTLELAALQSLFDPDEEFQPIPDDKADYIRRWELSRFQLDGQSDSAWRERIGNAVPPDAAAAIAGVMGTTLLLAMTGQTFMLSSQPIWVRPVALALSIDQRGNVPVE
ncbi:DNA cytosine methyltransferase [Rhizobium lusitanum]|uniref:DNA cytosine methyltransferase n=1 Tax=Rhizobium lusitanum TaxID=293958 RepID=A0A6L9U528_9HYPH|nr:DNA cytosine methyltransferase [Rhizobium lusitanum]NEI71033.1 DNA cytosine methyltransferase [Rhizobium lusitanum]